MKEEIIAIQDGSILTLKSPAKKGTIRLWYDCHEVKEGFGQWLQMSPQEILFDTQVGQGTKITLEYEECDP